MSVVRVKICGVTSEADATLAARLGADAIGLNFHPSSPRFIDAEATGRVLRALPPFVEPVGLYVNQPLREVFIHLNGLGRIRTFQWHGAARELCDAFPFQMIVAFPIRDRASLDEARRYLEMAVNLGRAPTAVLVDAHVPGLHGGTGQKAPWDLIADFHPPVPLILAGGLTPENVAEAVHVVRPYAVDVASGVESEPGKKDAEKMRKFIENVRST